MGTQNICLLGKWWQLYHFWGYIFFYVYMYLTIIGTTDNMKMLSTIDICWSKIARNSVFNSHLSPDWQQMATENYVSNNFWGAQWLSSRVLDSRQRGRGFVHHRGHCVVSLSKNINPSLVLIQPRKTRPFITERLLMGCKESNLTNKTCLKRSLKRRPKMGFQDQLPLNAGQKCCRMLQENILQYFRPSLSYHLS